MASRRPPPLEGEQFVHWLLISIVPPSPPLAGTSGTFPARPIHCPAWITWISMVGALFSTPRDGK